MALNPYRPAPVVLTAQTAPPATIGGPTVPTPLVRQVPAAVQLESQVLKEGVEVLTLRLTTPLPSQVRYRRPFAYATEPNEALLWTPTQTSAPVYGAPDGKSCPFVPPRFAGLSRNPWPYLPVVNIRLGLISTGEIEPRSRSGPHQCADQSCGWKNDVAAPRVGAVLITESLFTDPLQGIALPVAKKGLPVESSTTTPPGAQMPSAVVGDS